MYPSALKCRFRAGSAHEGHRKAVSRSSIYMTVPASTPSRPWPTVLCQITKAKSWNWPPAARRSSAANWWSPRARDRTGKYKPPRWRCWAGWTIPSPTPSAKSAIHLNTCAPWLICAHAPIPSAPLHGYATPSPRPCIAISTNRDSSGSTRQSSPPATVRAPANCSASPRWMPSIVPRTITQEISSAPKPF